MISWRAWVGRVDSAGVGWGVVAREGEGAPALGAGELALLGFYHLQLNGIKVGHFTLNSIYPRYLLIFKQASIPHRVTRGSVGSPKCSPVA